MLLYKDIISGDELFSDAYDLKLVDDVVYEVDGKLITIKEGEVDIGANASAEEASEELEEGAQQVINIVHSGRLTTTNFDKKSYLTYLKGYMKKVESKLLEQKDKDKDEVDKQVADFKKKAQDYAKKIVANFKDYEFYVGESMDPDGMVILLNYREDGVTPYFIFWKDGLKEEKM